LNSIEKEELNSIVKYGIMWAKEENIPKYVEALKKKNSTVK
jgi:hypothetical protein